MKYYYYLWVDSANALKSNNYSEAEARITSLLYISGVMALKLVVLVGLFELLFGINVKIEIDQFDSTKLNQVTSFLINYLLFPVFFNYTVVIRKTRWNQISEKYSRQQMGIVMKVGYFLGYYFIFSLVFILIGAIFFAIFHSLD